MTQTKRNLGSGFSYTKNPSTALANKTSKINVQISCSRRHWRALMAKTATIYIRVSTDRQTLENQRKALEGVAIHISPVLNRSRSLIKVQVR
jgi:hypothetical protein